MINYDDLAPCTAISLFKFGYKRLLLSWGAHACSEGGRYGEGMAPRMQVEMGVDYFAISLLKYRLQLAVLGASDLSPGWGEHGEE